MKLKKFLPLSVGLVLLTGSCSTDEMELLTQVPTPAVKEHLIPTRSLDDALGIAADWFAMQYPTRGEEDKVIGNLSL